VTEFPHVPAAFINVIAEEGTKAEAIYWLQRTWNELCYLRKRDTWLEDQDRRQAREPRGNCQ
jgi:hypothetical protein